MKDFYFLDKIFLQLNLLASTMFSKTADWIGEKGVVLSFNKDNNIQLCSKMVGLDIFFMLSIFSAGELESTSAEYQLLEQMNR